MFYVYVLQSLIDKNFYIGSTSDLKRRVSNHNNGLQFATSFRKPFKLIFYEAFLDKEDAISREKYLKTGWGRKHIRHALMNFLSRP